GHAAEGQIQALRERRRAGLKRRERQVGHLELARVCRILAGEMACRVTLDGPARRQRKLDVAAVEDEHALEAERLQPLAPIHWPMIDLPCLRRPPEPSAAIIASPARTRR